MWNFYREKYDEEDVATGPADSVSEPSRSSRLEAQRQEKHLQVIKAKMNILAREKKQQEENSINGSR